MSWSIEIKSILAGSIEISAKRGQYNLKSKLAVLTVFSTFLPVAEASGRTEKGLYFEGMMRKLATVNANKP
ncbi:MAG: hypothetical protein R3C03_07565 [Pirellulaceae bacterium]